MLFFQKCSIVGYLPLISLCSLLEIFMLQHSFTSWLQIYMFINKHTLMYVLEVHLLLGFLQVNFFSSYGQKYKSNRSSLFPSLLCYYFIRKQPSQFYPLTPLAQWIGTSFGLPIQIPLKLIIHIPSETPLVLKERQHKVREEIL